MRYHKFWLATTAYYQTVAQHHSRRRASLCRVPQTFDEVDLAGDGVISLEEWRTMVLAGPDVIGYMTLPVLKEVREACMPALACTCSRARAKALCIWYGQHGGHHQFPTFWLLPCTTAGRYSLCLASANSPNINACSRSPLTCLVDSWMQHSVCRKGTLSTGNMSYKRCPTDAELRLTLGP